MGTGRKHPWGGGQREKMARECQVSVYISIWLEESICDGERGSWKGRIGMSWEQGCGGGKDELLEGP